MALPSTDWARVPSLLINCSTGCGLTAAGEYFSYDVSVLNFMSPIYDFSLHALSFKYIDRACKKIFLSPKSRRKTLDNIEVREFKS